MIANCTIDSGDDSICLKSGNSRGVNDLLVKNCTITKSQSNGIKFGTASTGTFTNITFQDCTVLNTSHSAMAVESVDGGTISGVTFQRNQFFRLSECHLHRFWERGDPEGCRRQRQRNHLSGHHRLQHDGHARLSHLRLIYQRRHLPVEKHSFRQCEHLLRRRFGFHPVKSARICRPISRKYHVGQLAGLRLLPQARDQRDVHQLFHQRRLGGCPAVDCAPTMFPISRSSARH